MLQGGSDDPRLDLDSRTFSVVHTRLFEIWVDPDVRIHMQRFDICLPRFSFKRSTRTSTARSKFTGVSSLREI